MLCCRALQQQEQRGLTGYDPEYWVENGIQDCKSLVKYRSTHDPEIVIVNSLMVRLALAVMRRDYGYMHGQPYLQTLHERIPEMRTGQRRLKISDDGDANTGSQLLGLGAEPTVAQEPEVVNSIKQAVAESPEMWQANFPLHTVNDCTLTIYNRAHLKYLLQVG